MRALQMSMRNSTLRRRTDGNKAMSQSTRFSPHHRSCAWILVLLTGCLALTADTYYPPPESKGGWRTLVTRNALPTSSEKLAVRKTVGLNTDHLVDAWTYAERLGRRQSLIVIRHGWIAAEWDHVGIGPVNSATKSLTGLALAKLFELSDSGQISKKIGYDDFAYRYLPANWADSDSRRKLIKIRDLPTMCSGLEARGASTLKEALSLSVIYPPETVDQYSSGSVMLEAMVIENASGEKLKNFFLRHFTEPLGTESVRLWDAQGASGAAFMNTRDFARFGYLMLHKGSWDNGTDIRQILRPDLVTNCTTWPKFLRNVTDGRARPAQYLTASDPPSHLLHTWHGWWLNWFPDWPTSARSPFPFLPKDAFWMAGYGKDICLVIPSLDMVIAHQTARSGSFEQTLNDHPEFFSTLLSKLIAAVVKSD